MALIATPGAPDANAHVDVAYADEYLQNQRPYAFVDWSTYQTSEKESFLIWATFLMNIAFNWHGHPNTVEQSLWFPASGLYDLNGNNIDREVIPVLIKKGTVEFAFALSKRDRSAEPKLLGQGFSMAKTGPDQVVVDKTQVLPLIPDYIVAVLEPLGSVKGAATGGFKVLKLSRS